MKFSNHFKEHSNASIILDFYLNKRDETSSGFRLVEFDNYIRLTYFQSMTRKSEELTIDRVEKILTKL